MATIKELALAGEPLGGADAQSLAVMLDAAEIRARAAVQLEVTVQEDQAAYAEEQRAFITEMRRTQRDRDAAIRSALDAEGAYQVTAGALDIATAEVIRLEAEVSAALPIMVSLLSLDVCPSCGQWIAGGQLCASSCSLCAWLDGQSSLPDGRRASAPDPIGESEDPLDVGYLIGG